MERQGNEARAAACEDAASLRASPGAAPRDDGPPLLTGGVPREKARADGPRSVAEKPVCGTVLDAIGFKFDWYQATVRDGQGDKLASWAESLGDRVVEVPGLARKYRYRRGLKVLGKRSEDVCTVVWDADHGCSTIWASGDAAEPFVGRFRARFPEHDVTRVDVCKDFYTGLSFEDGQRRLAKIGEEVGVSMPYQDGDTRNHRAGRTQYLGSRSGLAHVRFYEKGKEVAAKHYGKGWEAHAAPQFVTSDGELFGVLGWVRLECEVRPELVEARQRLAKAERAAFWGVTPALRAVHQEFFGSGVEPTTIQRKTGQHPHEAKLRHMARQYANSLAWLQRHCDHLDREQADLAFGLAIRELLEARQSEQMTGFIRI